jgi:hypothetical protein
VTEEEAVWIEAVVAANIGTGRNGRNVGGGFRHLESCQAKSCFTE